MIKKLAIGLVAVVVLLLGIGMVLPQHSHVERSIAINAPPAQVWSWVSNFENFNKWSPWAALDPNTKYTFEGTPGTVGSKMSWVSDPSDVGSGSQQVTQMDKPKLVEVKLDFGADGKATAKYILEKEGDGTKFTWTFDGDMGNNPIGRWFGVMMDGMLGPQYEQGIASLKKLAEAGPAPGADASNDAKDAAKEAAEPPAGATAATAAKE